MSNIKMTVISKSKYFEYTGDGIPAETTPLFSFFLSAHVKYKGHHDDSWIFERKILNYVAMGFN